MGSEMCIRDRYVRKGMYEKALAKNKERRGDVPEYSFRDVKGNIREFTNKSEYEKALAINNELLLKRAKNKANEASMKRRGEKFSFVDVNGKKREYVRLIPYEKALAKNKAEREKRAQPTFSERSRAKRMDRGQPFNMKTPQNLSLIHI